MPGPVYLDAEVFHLDRNFVGFDEVLAVIFLSSRTGNPETEAFATHKNIHHAEIRDGGESRLLPDVVADIWA